MISYSLLYDHINCKKCIQILSQLFKGILFCKATVVHYSTLTKRNKKIKSIWKKCSPKTLQFKVVKKLNLDFELNE